MALISLFRALFDFSFCLAMIHLSDLSIRNPGAVTSTGDANVNGGQTTETPLGVCVSHAAPNPISAEHGRTAEKKFLKYEEHGTRGLTKQFTGWEVGARI